MLTLTGLVRQLVLFVIDLESRRVHIAGIVRQPHAAWMMQVARNLTDSVDGFLQGKRYLIHDRGALFTDPNPNSGLSGRARDTRPPRFTRL